MVSDLTLGKSWSVRYFNQWDLQSLEYFRYERSLGFISAPSSVFLNAVDPLVSMSKHIFSVHIYMADILKVVWFTKPCAHAQKQLQAKMDLGMSFQIELLLCPLVPIEYLARVLVFLMLIVISNSEYKYLTLNKLCSEYMYTVKIQTCISLSYRFSICSAYTETCYSYIKFKFITVTQGG